MCGTHISLAEAAPVSIHRLTSGQIAQAFPLLREGGRCDSLANWRDYALAFIGENPDSGWPAGIMVAAQRNRCIVGLYSYLVRPCLRFGRVLLVGDLAVMAPFGREVVAERLFDSVAELARAQRVSELEICLASASGWMAALLGKRGFALDDRRQIVWRRAAADGVRSVAVAAASPGD